LIKEKKTRPGGSQKRGKGFEEGKNDEINDILIKKKVNLRGRSRGEGRGGGLVTARKSRNGEGFSVVGHE